jgi:hypothetical protein
MSVTAPPTSYRSLSRLVEHPLGVVAILFLCILYMAGMAWQTYDDPVGADHGVYAVIGHELLNSRRLYADLWDHKPPAIHVVYAAAELVVGYGPQQLYLLNLVGWTIALLGLYQAGKLLVGSRAGLCAGLLWGFLVNREEWFTQPNTEVFISAALVWSYAFLLRLRSTPSGWWACAFGAAVGIASLFKPTAFASAGLLGLGYLSGFRRQEGGRWRAVRYMLAAAGVSLAIWVGCAAWFWGQGSFTDFYDAVFVYNRHYSGNLVQNLANALDHKRYLPVLLPCLLVPSLAIAHVSPVQRSGWLALAGWAAGCAIAIALAGHWYHHYYQLWIPVYALAGGALAMLPLSGALVKQCLWRLALLVPVLGPLAVPYRSVPSPSMVPSNNPLDMQRTGLAIDRELLPHETAYIFGYGGQTSGVYFASRRSPPSGVIYDFPLRGGPLASRLEERILRDLDRDPPDLIVLTKLSMLRALEGKPAEWGQRLVDWVTQHYVRRGFPASAKYAYYARRGSSLERRLPEEK